MYLDYKGGGVAVVERTHFNRQADEFTSEMWRLR